MDLENRYIVFKRADAEKYLSNDLKDELSNALAAINYGRQLNGKSPLSGLHIESGWPEYEPTKAALLARINNETPDWEAPARRSDHDVRIGGPGSIPQDTLDQWDRDAKEQLDRQMRQDILGERIKDRRTFERIAELYNVMMCSAERVIDVNGEHVGYKIKTGAVHNLLGVLKGMYLNAFIPNELPNAVTVLTDAAIDKLLGERDAAVEAADALAEKIAKLENLDVGGHDSGNDPWANALNGVSQEAA